MSPQYECWVDVPDGRLNSEMIDSYAASTAAAQYAQMVWDECAEGADHLIIATRRAWTDEILKFKVKRTVEYEASDK